MRARFACASTRCSEEWEGDVEQEHNGLMRAACPRCKGWGFASVDWPEGALRTAGDVDDGDDVG